MGKKIAGAGRPETRSTATTPAPAPVVVLSEGDKNLWTPLPPDRSRIPVLLYHGIGPASDFKNSVDAAYGISAEDFAEQMKLIKHAGFQTVSLETFLRFVQGEPVDLPRRPLLLTFDDGRTDSWTGADSILQKLGFSAVIFVDIDPVDSRHLEYLLWKELQTMQQSGRWEVQLHSGRGHTWIRWGPNPEDYGPFYAYKKRGESFEDWKHRTFSDIEWGQQELARHIPEYQPLAFAPPYGAYGQESWSSTCRPRICTNDSRIPNTLMTWLTERFHLVFTQDRSWFAKPGSAQPIGRFQLARTTSLQKLHDVLVGK